ncbi:MAG: hypothetical protein K0R00_140 [Herbinix sp.]|nr:hypothetical protein [Herbinix sp.]
MENNKHVNKKEKRELPVKQKIINQELNNAREELTRGQLELNFLNDYLEHAEEESLFLSKAAIQTNIETYESANKYYLAKMQYYKDLKRKSIEAKNKRIVTKAFEDYGKLPDKVVIDGDKVVNAK